MKIPVSGLSPLSKTLIQVKGLDTSRFLNGLITSRLLPNVVKKKQHTISESENRHADLVDIIDVNKNWGLMHEDIYDPDNNIMIRRDGLNSMFLNSKGRVVNDCFIYAYPFHTLNPQFEKDLEQPSILVELDNGFANQLLSLLKIHKLSAKVKISKQPSYYSYYYYNDTPEFDEWIDNIQYENLSAFTPQEALNASNEFIKNETIFSRKVADHIVGFSIDNRIPNFGIKIITDIPIAVPQKIENESEPAPSIPVDDLFSSSFKELFPFALTSEEVITRRRYLNGVFETQDAPKDSSLLPFESNLDYTNGLSLEKGCYVGQELTIRTFNNGIIRKRIVPVQFFEIPEDLERANKNEFIALNPSDPVVEDLKNISSSNITKMTVLPLVEPEHHPVPNQENAGSSPFSSSPFSDAKPTRKRKSSTGKLLSVQDNLGFILIGLSDIEKTDLYKIELPSLEGNGVKTIGLKVFKPDWWPEEE